MKYCIFPNLQNNKTKKTSDEYSGIENMIFYT